MPGLTSKSEWKNDEVFWKEVGFVKRNHVFACDRIDRLFRPAVRSRARMLAVQQELPLAAFDAGG